MERMLSLGECVWGGGAGGGEQRERQIEEKPKSLDLSLLLAEKGMRLLLFSLSLGGKRDILSP